jgi:hypothetical protein
VAQQPRPDHDVAAPVFDETPGHTIGLPVQHLMVRRTPSELARPSPSSWRRWSTVIRALSCAGGGYGAASRELPNARWVDLWAVPSMVARRVDVVITATGD